jgi:hypothetical protein
LEKKVPAITARTQDAPRYQRQPEHRKILAFCTRTRNKERIEIRDYLSVRRCCCGDYSVQVWLRSQETEREPDSPPFGVGVGLGVGILLCCSPAYVLGVGSGNLWNLGTEYRRC